MKEREGKKNLIDHVDPSRRSFVMQLLGGAAFIPPLIATFSMDTLTARAGEPKNGNISEPLNCNLVDEGYVGPNQFQALLSGPGTRANGVATLIITTPQSDNCASQARVTYELKLTSNAEAISGVIIAFGLPVATLPIGTPALIGPADFANVCDLDAFLMDLASGFATISLKVLVHGEEFTLSGLITPAVNSFIITLSPECLSW
jgi:hypothetical protein